MEKKDNNLTTAKDKKEPRSKKKSSKDIFGMKLVLNEEKDKDNPKDIKKEKPIFKLPKGILEKPALDEDIHEVKSDDQESILLSHEDRRDITDRVVDHHIGIEEPKNALERIFLSKFRRQAHKNPENTNQEKNEVVSEIISLDRPETENLVEDDIVALELPDHEEESLENPHTSQVEDIYSQPISNVEPEEHIPDLSNNPFVPPNPEILHGVVVPEQQTDPYANPLAKYENNQTLPDKSLSELFVGALAGYLVEKRKAKKQIDKVNKNNEAELKKQINEIYVEVGKQTDEIRRAARQKIESTTPIPDANKEQRVFNKDPNPNTLNLQPNISKAYVNQNPKHDKFDSIKKVSESLAAKSFMEESLKDIKTTPKASSPNIKTDNLFSETIYDRKSTVVTKEQDKILDKKEFEQVNVLKLSPKELLDFSEKISVEGTTLKDIYKSHLVGEKGLRRLVGTYLRGGNLKKALKRELIERQIDFERDPILRGLSADGSGGSSSKSISSTTSSKLDELIKEASQKIPVVTERITDTNSSDVASSQNPVGSEANITDIVMLGIIVILLGILLTLLFNRF